MEKEFVKSLVEAIKNNSPIEADGEDCVLFPNVTSVFKYGEGIAVEFEDGTEVFIKITKW